MAKRKYFFPIVFLLLLVAMFFSLRYGAVTSKWSDVTQALLHFDSNNQGEQLIRYLRLPRMLGAISVGAAFAISGALIQGITSNPIADSGLLGINSGAGLGLALVFCFQYKSFTNYGSARFIYRSLGLAVFDLSSFN